MLSDWRAGANSTQACQTITPDSPLKTLKKSLDMARSVSQLQTLYGWVIEKIRQCSLHSPLLGLAAAALPAGGSCWTSPQ